MKYLSQDFCEKHLKLVKNIQIYPYEYMDSSERFDRKKLLGKKDFYSLSKDDHISDEDYEQAKKAWNKFGMKNMRGYHDFYLQTDALLLSDVFEEFKSMGFEYCGSDPCHHLNSPGLSWSFILKITGVKLDLATDVDMYQFVEKDMREGFSYITQRCSKANNKYMKTYDKDKPPQYIIYQDPNSFVCKGNVRISFF